MFNFTHTDDMILELYVRIGMITYASSKALELLNDPEATEHEANRVIHLLNISLEKKV